MAVVLNVIFFLSTLALTSQVKGSAARKVFYGIGLVMSVVGMIALIVMSGWVAYTAGMISAGVSLLGVLGLLFMMTK
ncbi:hypothetical protein GLW08_11325 [Pontibacillus yanchengensis]|uniref:Uncharacterized protein n=2 Tax=Pontibacillus yanchengensis TaxID=462910 RepID=A0ACC7VGM1_9BACI|nr:hypothetical protein [Pontibacillus yanchengensis]MYL33903.1 hypothetical protein [Pontibacillus yanchengensis]MYL53928.1 hypothetical protein [Pontibacillus yanchengensis]